MFQNGKTADAAVNRLFSVFCLLVLNLICGGYPAVNAQPSTGALPVSTTEGRIPPAPTNLSGVARSASSIVLTWKDNAANESGFKIERRKTNAEQWHFIGRTPHDATTFESVGLFGETTYDHRIYAYNDAGNSARAAAGPVTTLKVPAESPGKVIVRTSTENVRNSEGTFVKLENGNLMLVYSSFAGVGDLDRARIIAKTSADDGDTWLEGRVLFSDPKISILLPSLIRLGNGEIGIGYCKIYSATQAVKVFRYSKDEGETWSNEIPISDDAFGYMTGSHDRFIKLANNRLINFVHAKIPGNNVGVNVGTHVYTSDDNGRTWARKTKEPLTASHNPFDKPEYGFWEATGVETSPGKIYALARTVTGWLYESRSNDGGESWSAPVQSNVPNPMAPARLEKVPGTKTMLLIHNPYTFMTESWHGGNRFILASRISDDDGATWKNYKEIFYDQNGNWFDYPAVFWDGDKLHLVCRDVTLKNGNWQTADLRYVSLSKEWFLQPLPNNNR